MPKTDAAAQRAARLTEALRQRRDHGAEYPLTAGRLRELADPAATDDELFKALAKAAPAVVVAARKDPASPVALAEDAEALARGEALVLYALGKLATAERPLHAPDRVVGKVDEALRGAFHEALQQRIASAALPAGVGKHEAKGKVQLYLEQFPPPPPPAPKKSPEQALAERLLAALAGRRDEGAPPVSLRQLARGVEPEPAEDALAKAARHKALKGHVVSAAPGDLDAPLARPGDEERLARSAELLRFAVGRLSTAEQPLHPLSKVAARLDKALRPAFEAAVREQAAANDLPADVAVHSQGDKLHLRLARHELPPPADEALARRLLAEIEAAGGPAVLDEVLARAAGDAAPKLVKAALARLGERLALAGPLVARAEDRARLLGDARLIRHAVETARTDRDCLVPLAGLGKKALRDQQPDFERAVEALAREGRLPEGVGCLWARNRPHLFLTADIGRWPAPVEEPAPEPAAEADFGRLYDEANERAAREQPAVAVSAGHSDEARDAEAGPGEQPLSASWRDEV